MNGELFDFNKKTGDKTGCVDLHEVEEFLSKVKELINEQNEKKFKIEDNLGHLTDGYFKRKDQYDPTAKIKDGRKDPSEKYV